MRSAERAARERVVAENADVPGHRRRDPSTAPADEGRDEVTTSTPRDDGRPSIGTLVSDLTEKFRTLVRDEIRLAMTELKQKATRAGIGLGLFAAAGIVAFWAFPVLVTVIILAIAEALPAWLAALIVFVVMLGVMVTLVVVGRKQLAKGTPPTPTRAQASVKADVEAIREGLAKDGTADTTTSPAEEAL